MAASGFPYSLIIDGVESNWKNITWGDDNPGVDASSRILPDGQVNTGYSDRDYDLSTLTFTCTEPAQKAGDNRGDISTQPIGGFASGYRDETVTWYFSYDGITVYSGIGLVCTHVGGNGSIPGDGTITATFQAIGEFTRAL